MLKVFGHGEAFNPNALLFGSAAGSFDFAALRLRMTGSNASTL